jgi:hypothetical protein
MGQGVHDRAQGALLSELAEWLQRADYSSFTPARFTTWLQRPISFLMIEANS